MAGQGVSQDELDRRRRKRTFKLTLEELSVELSNEEGLRRLESITDEEWQAAVEEDGGGSDAS